MKRRVVAQVQVEEAENIDPRRKGPGNGDLSKMKTAGETSHLARLARSTASSHRKFGAQVDPSAVNQEGQSKEEKRPATTTTSRIPKPGVGTTTTRGRFGFQAIAASTSGQTTDPSSGSTTAKGVSIPVVPGRIGGRRRPPTPVSLAQPCDMAAEDDTVHPEEEERAPSKGGVKEVAERCLLQKQSDAETLVKTKIRISARADIKEKLGKRDEAIKALREGLSSLLQGTKEFCDGCSEVEESLRALVKGEQDNASRAGERLEGQLKEALGRIATFETQMKEVEKGKEKAVAEANQREASLANKLKVTEQDLETARTEGSKAAAERDQLQAQLCENALAMSSSEQGAHDRETALKEEVHALSEEVQRLKTDKAALETAIVDLSGRVREGEARQAAEASEKSRLEGETARLLEEVRDLRASLSDRVEEVGDLKLSSEKRAAELAAENIELQSRRREEETARVKAEEEVQRLAAKLEGIRDAVDEKNKELSEALKGFTDMQRSTQERELELRKSLRETEERAAKAEARCSEVESQVQQLKTDAASSTAEMSVLRESLALARSEASSKAQENTKAQAALQEVTASFAVERQLRARAELKEEEERRERIAANAQLLAMQQAHSTEMETLRAHELEVIAEWSGKVQEEQEDRGKLLRDLRDAQETTLTRERELEALRTSLESAESRTKELAELGRLAGEADVLKHRLIESERERVKEEEKFKAQIAELEATIQSGEDKRRKMHNQIQELRGNVRVYARIRPFLPSDKTAAGALACIDVNQHDDSMAIRKVGPDGNSVLESHRFSFDKCFPPSTGQSAVFEEVSEFVQSALDGYNVCLFSYGQTGSGKTHTMQGFGQGPMKGIIPRAMEQVGKYKTQLEGQGWEYHMEVTFIEIYNETIRDLLKSLSDTPPESTPSATPDIRKDAKGNLYISDATVIALDPNDTQAIERIMEVAGRHRSVGSTDMNATSSRSHSVFTLHLQARNAEQRAELRGKLNLVDLAGSERLSRSGATGDRLKETQAINKSLSALTDVFVAIGNKQNHVPFRNSKLTYLLQQCLTGDGKALMMINLSPSDESYFESLCTLRFAAQVNKCELGRPRRNLQTHPSGGALPSSSSSSSSSASSSVVVERVSTLSQPTASSSTKGLPGSIHRPAGGGRA